MTYHRNSLTHPSEESDKKVDTETKRAKKIQCRKEIGSRSKEKSNGNNRPDLNKIRVWWARGQDKGKKENEDLEGTPWQKREKKQFTEIWSLRSSNFQKKEKRVPAKRKERPNRASTEKNSNSSRKPAAISATANDANAAEEQ